MSYLLKPSIPLKLQVVAPVRETCAQTLGAVLKFMTADSVPGVVNVALQLLGQDKWEVRHGALLSLKYILAIRQDLVSTLLATILPAIQQGLQDPDDDVRAVAASALIPVTDALGEFMPDQVPLILSCLWNILIDLDDLTASTNSIMTLLAKLMSHPLSKASPVIKESLMGFTPRLWPFLRHNIMSVRKAALETLLTLLTLCDGKENSHWLVPIYQDAVRHIYQRSVLEERAELLPLVQQVWEKLLACANMEHLYVLVVPWLGVWLAFLMQPPRIAFDPALLIEAKHKPRDSHLVKARFQGDSQAVVTDVKHYIGGSDTSSGTSPEKDAAIYRARVCGARLLGMLANCLSQSSLVLPPEQESPAIILSRLFSFHMQGKSAVQRFVVGQVLYFWASHSKACPCPPEIVSQLLACLGELIYFDEIAVSFTRMQSDCQDFLASLKQEGVNLDSLYPARQLLTLESALSLTTTTYRDIRQQLKPQVQTKFDERQKQLLTAVQHTSQDQQTYSVRVLCSLAMAIVAMNALPEKLTPVVRPLMDVIKKEENEALQEEAAVCLAQLIKACIKREPSPNSKIVKNLCNFLCIDPCVTPQVATPVASKSTSQGVETAEASVPCTISRGILTLSYLQRVTEDPVRRRGRKPGSAAKAQLENSGMGSNSEAELLWDKAEQAELQKQVSTQRQGAECALTVLCRIFAEGLPEQVPALWTVCADVLKAFDTGSLENNDDLASLGQEPIQCLQDFINSLQTLETVLPSLNKNLILPISSQLEKLCSCLHHPSTAVRYMSSRVLAALSLRDTPRVMHFVVDNVLPFLDAMDSLSHREGGTEAVANILCLGKLHSISDLVESLGLEALPYLVLLVIPVLGRMSDQALSVRLMATHCFASLVRLMPLEGGVPDPPTSQAWLIERKETQRKFLDQLFNLSKLDDYHITVPVNAELRKYQQDGVNWIGFLNKYKLHGILCDDMGLGKTLQSICVLATDHKERAAKYKESQDPGCVPMPSIVVCPPTLVGHWVYEVKKFVDESYLNPLMYAGPPTERLRLQKKVSKHNLIIASYDVVRNDVEFFSNIKWNYCILDEGHIIRNGKTKLAKATKQLPCNHRLILSGTPIQNNVLDLWSLFDFLMPGFLGTERQFQARYGRPILQSRDAKSSSREQEAGALAMEALHRQVLPFILRRLKEDVLQDLPPKIMQDYYCDLSPLQIQLYEDFAKSRAKRTVDETVTGGEDSKDKKVSSQGTAHIFQALQYLRKVCNHPALVLGPSHPRHKEILSSLNQGSSPNIHDIVHAPKLTALKQLLNDCGIGNGQVSSGSAAQQQSSGVDSAPVVNQHRVLLFCQLKGMLDIVEKDLLKSRMPSVTYLRLDGTVAPGSRHDIVHRFNNDPSIDILLLTTHVGGLGLNLTGADTVIFVEHDWNPMKDLQKFKLAVANTVITQENSSLQTMGTDQLLDLFVLDQQSTPAASSKSSGKEDKPGKRETVRSILDGLEELWDESQYESEYNMEAFMESLAK
ncbi:TATA-binding protein-associated factor 172 [Elysia marginata]|uniref:TATA-binding protein-associated factor 172 n=1 Tax=Elysia marginata TaxID=1093978 RepID=A0AAV4EDG0_9GAST|nr:TATA-binding protein-associated factor 172 [Elysia marginata]